MPFQVAIMHATKIPVNCPASTSDHLKSPTSQSITTITTTTTSIYGAAITTKGHLQAKLLPLDGFWLKKTESSFEVKFGILWVTRD